MAMSCAPGIVAGEVKILRLHRVGMFPHDVLRGLLAGTTRSMKGDQNILWLVTSMKASTICGSNWEPEHRSISVMASARVSLVR